MSNATTCLMQQVNGIATVGWVKHYEDLLQQIVLQKWLTEQEQQQNLQSAHVAGR